MVLRILFIGGLGSAGLMFGLHDLRGLFQPKQFNDSILQSRHSCRKSPHSLSTQ